MLIKYRSGLIHSAGNIIHSITVNRIVKGTIVHMERFFTFKKPIFRWQLATYMNQSTAQMDISGKNDVLALSFYKHSVLEHSSLGMIQSPEYLFYQFCSHFEK